MVPLVAVARRDTRERGVLAPAIGGKCRRGCLAGPTAEHTACSSCSCRQKHSSAAQRAASKRLSYSGCLARFVVSTGPPAVVSRQLLSGALVCHGHLHLRLSAPAAAGGPNPAPLISSYREERLTGKSFVINHVTSVTPLLAAAQLSEPALTGRSGRKHLQKSSLYSR